MANFFSYLLGVSFRLMVFYALYRLFYRRLNFHHVNRFILLSILLLSFVFIRIEEQPNSSNILINNKISHSIEQIERQLRQIGMQPETELSTNSTKSKAMSEMQKSSIQPKYSNITKLSIWDLIAVVYFLVAGLLLLKLLNNGIHLGRLLIRSDKKKIGKSYVLYAPVPSSFSFFLWVVLPENDKTQNKALILEHEALHARFGHSLDLIFIELINLLLWFNPIIYWLKKDLRAVHEFQVDEQILKNKTQKADYLQLILDNMLSKYKQIGLYNYFNGINIKKRIDMMNKKKQAKRNLISYLILIPVGFMVCASFTTKEIVQTNAKLPQITVPLALDAWPPQIIKENQDSTPSIEPIAKGQYTNVTGFGMRIHPIYKDKRMHTGIDFAAPKNTPVVATADGTVSLAKSSKRGFGNRIEIRHSKEIETRYAHLSYFIVKKGQRVKKGEVIAYVGNTGQSTTPHLHYEIIKNNKPVNPKDYMPKKEVLKH